MRKIFRVQSSVSSIVKFQPAYQDYICDIITIIEHAQSNYVGTEKLTLKNDRSFESIFFVKYYIVRVTNFCCHH